MKSEQTKFNFGDGQPAAEPIPESEVIHSCYFPPKPIAAEQKHETIMRYIMSSTNVEQLHVCYNLLGLYKLGKRDPGTIRALTTNFDIKARALGYYDWKSNL